MGDNYCTTAASSLDQGGGGGGGGGGGIGVGAGGKGNHKDRQAVDYIFTDQAPDSLEEEDPVPSSQRFSEQRSSAANSDDPQRKGETNIVKRFFSMFSWTTPKGGAK